ncbi:MAG TPA: ABC transporter substrate-binding protein [Blastocatellia bacterium]|nr:ABC transporter substrate-binding protein [Blastocatellia bacterium]
MRAIPAEFRRALTTALSHFVGEGARSRRRIRCCAVVALLLLASCSATSSSSNSEVTKIAVLSYPDRPAKLPLWLAQDAGLFNKYGLNVEIETPKSGEEIVEEAEKNSADIYVATANWMVSAIGDGADLVFFANTGYSVLKLVSRPEITRVEVLKGKRIGTGEPGSSQDRITRESMRRLGFDADKDVTLVPFGSRSVLRLNALLKGEIDATTSNEDNLFDLERRGEIDKVRVLADNDSLKLFIGAGVDFAVTRSLLVKSRDAVKRFVQALSEAIALARRDRGVADQIYSKYLKVSDPALLEFMYRTYVQHAIPEKPYPKLDNVALGIAEFAAKPGLKGKSAEALTDLSLVGELESEGFFISVDRARPEHGERAE